MGVDRRRRIRPIKRKKTAAPVYRPRKARIGFKDSLIQFLIILFVTANLVLVAFVIRQCAGAKEGQEAAPAPEPARPLQIEVLNGCGVDGVANRFTDFLRKKGFDVVKTGNYEEQPGRPNFNVLQTTLIERREGGNTGIRVAQMLGLDRTRVLQEASEAYLIDASVIVGKDFRSVPAWPEME